VFVIIKTLHYMRMGSTIYFAAYIHCNFSSGWVKNTLSEQGLRLFPETTENLPTQFTPFLCLYALKSNKYIGLYKIVEKLK